VGEMAKNKITIESVSKTLGMHRNSISYKLEKGTFEVGEAVKIRDSFFPEWTIEDLFKTLPDEKGV